jgi:hypothetical protein
MLEAGGRGMNLFRKVTNEETLLGIMNYMPPAYWKQWAKERPSWEQEDVDVRLTSSSFHDFYIIGMSFIPMHKVIGPFLFFMYLLLMVWGSFFH